MHVVDDFLAIGTQMKLERPGKGTICGACTLPVTGDDVEVECDLVGGGTYRFHRRCYEVWAEARPACDART